jgi:DNA-binding NtrC family response regulator
MQSDDKQRVLVVEDDEQVRSSFVELLGESGFSTLEASGGVPAIESFEKMVPDAVLLDLNLPGMGGKEILQRFRRINPLVPIIIVSGRSDISIAVDLIKLGAYDFIVKPPDLDTLVITLRRAVEKHELKRVVERLNVAVGSSLEWLLGRSNEIKKVIDQISQVATSDFSVIIQGETGTGKSFVARALHNLSRRTERPFVTVDIGAIPETLVESELFGHERGAFTGAEKKKKGFFEISNSGTIVIDELQNMSPYVQSKLLSVIEEKKMHPLGSTQSVDVDVRIIAATNSDIRQCVKQKKFREDLFYRLGEFIITLPPLNERVEDIPFLAQRFLVDAASELNKKISKISDDTAECLKGNPWLGNVRELKNVIRRAVLLAEGDVIRPEHINFLMEDRTGENAPLMSLKEISVTASREAEKKAISQVLGITGGNKTKAASMLKIDYKTLLTKMKNCGIK